MKIQMVINQKYGGFGLSKLAIERLKELGMKETKIRLSNETDENFEYRNFEAPLEEDRTNPLLVQIVKELGEGAWGRSSSLRAIEFEFNPYQEFVHYYDGLESLDINYEFIDNIEDSDQD